jgi:hypothetical protein
VENYACPGRQGASFALKQDLPTPDPHFKKAGKALEEDVIGLESREKESTNVRQSARVTFIGTSAGCEAPADQDS